MYHHKQNGHLGIFHLLSVGERQTVAMHTPPLLHFIPWSGLLGSFQPGQMKSGWSLPEGKSLLMSERELRLEGIWFLLNVRG